VDVVVKGRNVVVPEHFRQHVSEKLRRVERYDHKLIRVDVELFHEPNRRQSQSCQRVEITCKSRGPVMRSEACSRDFYSALDAAITKLDGRFRRAADRRRVHHGRHTPISVAAATASVDRVDSAPAGIATLAPSANGSGGRHDAVESELTDEPDEHLPGLIVREKVHTAKPMTLDQALFEMELVGHDFYLFSDEGSGQPSVVYRRKGYDYGVIRLAQ
jgi:ribosomal subunit interface protein